MTVSALTDLISLLTNPSELRRDNVPPLRPTSVEKLPVREFVFAAQVVLRQYFGVCLELIGAHWLA
jgi:hypothetical protein